MAVPEFSGNIAHTLDPKGRVIIPAIFREALGEQFTIGLNNEFNAIALYPAEKWARINEGLAKIPDTDAIGMDYVRLISGNSFPKNDLDGQGRVLLPVALRQKANMTKNIRFVGASQYLEIWDEDLYAERAAAAEANRVAILKHVNDQYFKPKA